MKLFLMGRPGSGKSTVATWLCEIMDARVLDCFSCLCALWQAESTKTGRFLAAGRDSFEVADNAVYDEMFAALDAQICVARTPVIIEIAAPDYDIALARLSPAARMDAHYLYLDSPPDRCLARIRQRNRQPEIPERKWRSLFAEQKPPQSVPCHVISNTGSMTDLDHAVSTWLFRLS